MMMLLGYVGRSTRTSITHTRTWSQTARIRAASGRQDQGGRSVGKMAAGERARVCNKGRGAQAPAGRERVPMWDRPNQDSWEREIGNMHANARAVADAPSPDVSIAPSYSCASLGPHMENGSHAFRCVTNRIDTSKTLNMTKPRPLPRSLS
jgi:hypothetical protein